MSNVIERNPANAVNLAVLGEPDAATIDALTAAVQKNLKIDEILALRGGSQSLDIGKIELDNSSAEQVTVEELSMRVHCGSACLKDVRAIIELSFTAHWEYDLKWLGSDSGVKALGKKANTVSLHDIALPMLEDFVFDVPVVDIEDIEVTVDPIQDLKLGGSELEGLRVSQTDAPTGGLSITNLDLGELEITGVKIPGTHSQTVTIDRFRPNDRLNLPAVSLGPITVPAIEIDDVQSDGAVSVMGAELQGISAPVFKIGDLFKIKIVVDPVLHLQFGSVVLSDLEASARMNAVSINNIESDVNVEAVSMQDLELQDVNMNRAELA
ncbi:MAG: hypothetical protein KTR32_39350 [Granulosicoccus sp.]|nr:hypothetical protein [Granulosicoccus sp.]